MLTPTQQVKYKKAARAYAVTHHLPIPRGFVASFPGVRSPARSLFWTIQHHAGLKTTGVLNEPLRNLLIPPPKPTGPVYGVDVSNHQPSVPWAAVRASGAQFAILKASEGTSFADPYYARHRAAANAAGIVIGAYHFARPSGSDGAAEARHFLAIAKPKAGDLIPALDLEVSDGVSASGIQTWIRGFNQVVWQATGHQPFLYTYPAFWRGNVANTHQFSDMPLWIANYGVSRPDVPGGWSSYAIWQFTSSGYLRGVPGRVDRNVAPRGIENLRLA